MGKMIMERIKSAILGATLALYNAAAFVVINVLMWKNNIWNEKRWTAPIKKAEDSSSIPPQ
ncbi:MAG: hypothetical protein WC690_04410 [bacterium]